MLELLVFIGLCLAFGFFRVLGCLFSIGLAVLAVLILIIGNAS